MEEHFKQYWEYVKDVVDENGWVHSKDVTHLLDFYFETNTNIKIEFEKRYDGENVWSDKENCFVYRGYRWRPITLKK